eukprot:GHRQ01024091.1.p2 GENE.GHRQ01024091.1~~GHRQ01024091.1.p2  ORF type:complete len:145 (-),score=62.26 GHRQ01024091.1:795-1229(-)
MFMFALPARALRLQCFINGVVDEAVTDLRACPELHGEVAFPKGMPPYPFGVDPAWHGTKSELPFLNSMKMKMSILLGVVHMNLGILMSLFNNLYFKDRLSTICEFVPQVRGSTDWAVRTVAIVLWFRSAECVRVGLLRGAGGGA